MKFRNKINFVIISILFFQVIIIAIFTINNFIYEREKFLFKELEIKKGQLESKINDLKHFSFNYLVNIGNYLTKEYNDYPSSEKILKTIKNYLPVFQYNNLFVVDQNLNTIYKNSFFINSFALNVLPKSVYKSYHYKFPSTKFYYFKENNLKKLIMISGYWINWNMNEKYGIFLVIDFDNNFIKKLSEEINSDLAIFCNNVLISSSTPVFHLNQKKDNDNLKVLKHNLYEKVYKIKIENEDYYFLQFILSTDFNNRINLGVLRSLTDNKIYTVKLLKSIVTGFLITLLLVFILSIFLTTIFTRPILNLHSVLIKFLNTGKLEKFKVTTNDEIGFFAKSFYNLAKDLIRDKELIKKNLEEITFLNEYNEIILKNIQSGIIVFNYNMKIEYCNNYFYDHLKFDKKNILNKDFVIFFKNFFKYNFPVKKIKENLKSERFNLENVILKLENKERIKFYVKFIKIQTKMENKWKFLVLFEDVTKAEILWQKMLQAEKITSLGILSAGVAHEINNPLSIILSHVQYLKEVEKDKNLLNSLNWIESETKRIASIISKMLNFVSETKENFEIFNFNKIILEIIDFFKFQFKKKGIKLIVELDRNMDNKKRFIKMKKESLNQILFNLIINSISAIEEKQRKKDSFSAEKGDKNNWIIKIKTFSKNNNVILEISDNGIGIDENDKNYIFDPFFTTKGNGTGLGLSVIYNIIKNANGEIWFNSLKNKGTSFYVRLPF